MEGRSEFNHWFVEKILAEELPEEGRVEAITERVRAVIEGVLDEKIFRKRDEKVIIEGIYSEKIRLLMRNIKRIYDFLQDERPKLIAIESTMEDGG